MSLHPKLRTLTNKIENETLRKKVIELLDDPTFKLGGKEFSGPPLDVSPAGLAHHHSYKGGYIQHVVSAAEIALTACDSVKKIYCGKIDRDLVIAGVLLHDLFKPVTYVVNENGTYSSSNLADYMDHMSLAMSEMVRREFPLELIHIVAAHHGVYGPVRPRTIEALVCHLADWMDSRLNGEVLSAAAYLTRRATGEELRRLDSKEAFEIVYSKATEGWKGVAKTVEKIRQKRRAQKP